VNQFKDMLAYNNACMDDGVDLYNKLRPAGSSLTRSEIESKVNVWSRLVSADPSKRTAVQHNLEDFLEFAPILRIILRLKI